MAKHNNTDGKLNNKSIIETNNNDVVSLSTLKY